jgi:Uma2 family endonuclease
MAAQPRAGMTVEEYLAFERASAEKHEYRDGELVAMVGASYAHNTIVGNVFASLRARLRDSSCRVNFSDLRVQIPGERFYTYPDLTVVCGPPRFSDDRQDTLLNPQVIIEVLSPSTELYDRGAKFQRYRSIVSLREYLLIAQDSARIEHFARQGETLWTLTDLVGLEVTLSLASLDCAIPLAEIYEEIAFATAEDDTVRDSGQEE